MQRSILQLLVLTGLSSLAVAYAAPPASPSVAHDPPFDGEVLVQGTAQRGLQNRRGPDSHDPALIVQHAAPVAGVAAGPASRPIGFHPIPYGDDTPGLERQAMSYGYDTPGLDDHYASPPSPRSSGSHRSFDPIPYGDDTPGLHDGDGLSVGQPGVVLALDGLVGVHVGHGMHPVPYGDDVVPEQPQAPAAHAPSGLQQHGYNPRRITLVPPSPSGLVQHLPSVRQVLVRVGVRADDRSSKIAWSLQPLRLVHGQAGSLVPASGSSSLTVPLPPGVPPPAILLQAAYLLENGSLVLGEPVQVAYGNQGLN